MNVFLDDLRWCFGRFGKSGAEAILRQVRKLSFTEENCPEIGDEIDMGGFYLRVTARFGQTIHVMIDRVKP